jgi:hypothetical protein
MPNFKQEMIDLAHEFANSDPDFKTVAVDVLHRRYANRTYDVESGGYYDYTSDVMVTGFLVNFTKDKFNGEDVIDGDVLFILPKKELLQGVTLQKDLFITSDEREYIGYSMVEDAADAAYQIQLRLRNG